VASFAKKLARLALVSPHPCTAVFCLAFAYNLLRRNPVLVFLVHDTKTSHKTDIKLNSQRLALGLKAGTGAEVILEDPFDFECEDFEVGFPVLSSDL
jgi:hypothetical protein